ncbi:FMN-dependent NADH-azoreductase [Allosphingosinicella indica]|uniref:FMN dependent NADH:quinone oxidoreductase n=1 Tax=Allosphingosinicella indica TaxID=941907 RepID=A0A1X7GPG1_9SPHN|nr:NAD(P)H-dependent oxidoreductase [Allosphingosinicella indica]SMF72787.1 FMN-dependent NADH-azoreductase [Allosphingosinicella indica]
MQKFLVIDSAVTGAQSVSRKLTDGLVSALAGEEGAVVTRRDVGHTPIPHLTEATVGAIRGAEAESAEARAALALSDTLVAELFDADVIVVAVPMYNFGMPSTLKAWFDHVLRAKVTFQYGANGAEGLLKNKRAIIVSTRAGGYAEGDGAAMDSQEPHVRTLLGFMGITDVEVVRAEKLAFGPEVAETAIADAGHALGRAVRAPLALAA